MACAVECMAPHLGQERPDQRDEHCGAASVQAAKEQERAPEQGAERQEGTGSPDTREDAGASSGESNTQKVELHGEAVRYHSRVSEPADPSRLAPSGQSGKGETDEKAAGAKDGKAGKLPRPEGSTPCPRCDSMDTKFCYYNNYNVKQPRYFCKGCQRYWTAGGTLRNVPVGAGRRKNKSSAAKEAVREHARKASSKESSMDTSFLAFPGLIDPALNAYGAGPMVPGKAAIPGFVPNLAVPGQLSPLAMPHYPAVDPAAASALQGCLAAAFDGSVPQPSFGAPSLTPSLSNQRAGSLDDDGSRGGRRVRARRAESEAVPADSAINVSTLYGSASTVTDLRTLANSAHGSTLNGSGLSLRGAPESTHSHHHSQLLTNPGDSNNGSSFQPFHSASAPSNNGSGFAKVPVNSSGMHPDWISMAAAAGQQQAVAAQHQLQYQAAAMQAQAMHAAAANAAWNQSNNPYLSGLCFPYNLYGAAGVQQQQLYAAYASLAPQASPWGGMDGGASGNLPTPAMSGGQAGSNVGSAQVPTSQPAMSSWGINSNGVSPGDSSSLHPMQQWMPSSGRSHAGSQSGAREMAGAWQQWPAHGGELAMAAENKMHASKVGKFGGMGMPAGLHPSNNATSILSGSSGNSSLTADLHNGARRPAPSFNTSA